MRLEVDKLLWLAASSPAAAQLLQAIMTARPGLRVHKLPLPLQPGQLQARYDLCLVLTNLTNLISGTVTQDLARLKNQFCNRIELVLLDAARSKKDCLAADTALFALGFRRSGQFELAGQTAQCYCYALKSYNKKRSWNSPENWANPQNFDKYRW
ncbi:MAG: hypothetical protein KJO24_03310 [Gammaproteobacteria bacterium]|nr:hypothetical protein [Gammaproteobacteria bacterium]